MALDIRTVGIIGAGQMGNGIAHVCAAAGLDVRLNDRDSERVATGLSQIDANLVRQVQKGSLTDDQRRSTLQRIVVAPSFGDLEACWVVDIARVFSVQRGNPFWLFVTSQVCLRSSGYRLIRSFPWPFLLTFGSSARAWPCSVETARFSSQSHLLPMRILFTPSVACCSTLENQVRMSVNDVSTYVG